jgi:hypothetical protein
VNPVFLFALTSTGTMQELSAFFKRFITQVAVVILQGEHDVDGELPGMFRPCDHLPE